MARSTYDDFNIKEKIGSGSYGVVFKVVRKVDRMTYAMKEIDLQGMSRKEQEECIRETRVLSSLDSDYIIKYYDSFLERGKLYIITEYASNGNLHDYIKKHREVTKQRLPEDLIWKLFIQILMGLNHMHTRKILHRDIKTLNVFLDDDLNVKLGDMGVAKILSTQTNFAKTIVGTPYYLSPELCEDKPYNEKSDVWALGVVLYECCVQRHPFDADNQGALILKILRGKYPPVQGYSPEVSDIIKRCLTQNANRRPNTYKLLLLPCVREQGGNAGIALPDQPSLVVLAEKQSSAKMTRGPIAAKPVVAAVRPVSAVRPASAVGPGGAEAGQHTKDLPPLPGDMQQPPNAPASSSAQDAPAASTSQNPDKAFVFGGTAGKGKQQFDAKPKEPSQGAGNQGLAGGGAAPMDLGSTMPSRQEAAWKATPGAQAQGGPEEGGRPPAWGNAGAAQGAANRVPPLNGLSLHEEDEEEEERHNPYDNPREYRDPNDPDDQEEESGEGEEGEEDFQEEGYSEDEDLEGEEDGEDMSSTIDHGMEGSTGWQPDPVRLQHMRSAMMIQRAACLDLIGEKAFNELYALLKSNQVDEASMTDLSRLVFKIIPYDKSEVIQMMYKLLYLESQTVEQ